MNRLSGTTCTNISSRGFTIIELMISIAVMGLLMTLLIPAVQHVRESARQTQCRSNLHQISLAAHQYVEIWKVFPASPRWHRQIGPYIEMPEDAQIEPLYACPSDPEARGELPFGKLSYLPCDGVRHIDENGLAGPHLSGQHRLADVTDGLSNTVAYAERLVWPSYAPIVVGSNPQPSDWIRRIHHMSKTYPGLDEFANACLSKPLPPGPAWQGVSYYNHVLPPNNNSCFSAPRGQGETNQWAVTATSEHPGGVHVLFADGHVRFVNESIDRDVWRAVGTRNGEEALSMF